MRNVILGILLCAVYAKGNNVIDDLEVDIRQPHSTLLTQQLSGPSTGPSGTTCNNKGICENQPDGAMFSDSGSNGYIVCQCECAITRPCPTGLVFNPVVNACDWPLFNTGASGTSSSPSDISTKGTPSTPSSTQKYTISAPSPSTLSDITTKSPPTTSSSPATGPSGTTCNNKGVCENQPDGALFPDSGSIGYIVCQCECEIPMFCPSGLVFNPVINACDWPLVNSSPCNIKGVCENHPDGILFPDSGSNGYIVCQYECGIPMSCPSGLVFNSVINACDWPLVNTDAPGTSSSPSDITTKDTPSTPLSTSKYKTSSPSPSTLSEITTKSPPTTSSNPATRPSGTTCNNKGVCENQPDGALFPDSGSNGYIVCQCECGISRPCPSGSVFNSVLSVCDWRTSN